MKKSVEGDRNKIKVMKEHKHKYQKYWDKSHSAKLSTLRKYDLSEARYRNINKDPRNILVFNGKLLDYLKKMNN